MNGCQETKMGVEKAIDLVLTRAIADGYAPQDCAAGREAALRARRWTHPEGSFDKQGRFYLSEHCPACASIREPSKAWPTTQNTHGRSVRHVAHLHGACPTRTGCVVRAVEIAVGIDAEMSSHTRLAAHGRIADILVPKPERRKAEKRRTA